MTTTVSSDVSDLAAPRSTTTVPGRARAAAPRRPIALLAGVALTRLSRGSTTAPDVASRTASTNGAARGAPVTDLAFLSSRATRTRRDDDDDDAARRIAESDATNATANFRATSIAMPGMLPLTAAYTWPSPPFV